MWNRDDAKGAVIALDEVFGVYYRPSSFLPEVLQILVRICLFKVVEQLLRQVLRLCITLVQNDDESWLDLLVQNAVVALLGPVEEAKDELLGGSC